MVLGCTATTVFQLSFTGLSPSMAVRSNTVHLSVHSWPLWATITQQYPASRMPQRVASYMTYVFSFSRFAHHYSGNHIRFLFLALLRCFSSGRYPPCPIYSDKDIQSFSVWVPSFGHPRINAWLTTPRGITQSSTSFIDCWCQGIHQMLFSITRKFFILQQSCMKFKT